MSLVRSAAVAGQFYPDSQVRLRSMVSEFLEHAPATGAAAASPKAVIAPHAGYI